MTDIKKTLQSQRQVLLDLTYRNRLLSLPKKPSSRSITVYDELTQQVLVMLLEKKVMTFAPIRESALEEQLAESEVKGTDDGVVFSQPEDDECDENGVLVRHTDTKLQTKLKSEHLQKRLLEIFYEARTMMEEQGVNVLYLAFGQLRFREKLGSDEFRTAPLLLLPVELERKSVRQKFQLRWSGEDLQDNLSLREKLRVDFSVKLPDFPEIGETFDVKAYFDSISDAISSQNGWAVMADAIQLGFFSFAKLLMFLDLDPAKWPEGKAIDQNALVAGLLGEGFEQGDHGIPSSGSSFLDKVIPAANLKHVMDCDSSQALAIETVRKGHSLVIQGPPGTGKSQSISNLIATAVNDGKKVLFVAEKMAALEVVKRRLENVGLGPMCLEVHSNKSNKRAVLEDLGKTMSLARPSHVDVATEVQRLEEVRTKLNYHAQKMHEPFGVAGLKPFDVVGELSKRMPNVGRPQYRLTDAGQWAKSDVQVRCNAVRELSEYQQRVGNPKTNIWRGATHPPVMRPTAEDIANELRKVAPSIQRTLSAGKAVAASLNLPTAANLAGFEKLASIAEALSTAPKFDRSTIASGVWSAGVDSLREAIRSGVELNKSQERWKSKVSEVAWDIDWASQRMMIAGSGRGFFRWLNGSYRIALNQLKSVVPSGIPKEYEARLSLLDDLIAGYKARVVVNAVSATAKNAFGSVWQGEDTDWRLAASILSWVSHQQSTLPEIDVRTLASQIDDQSALTMLAAELRSAIQAFRDQTVKAVQALRMDESQAWDGVPIDAVDLPLMSERASQWPDDVSGLLDWLTYAEVVRRSVELGLQQVMEAMAGSESTQLRAVEHFWVAYYLEMLSDATKAYPDLAKFDGQQHSQLVNQFRRLDKSRLSLAQVETAQKHYEGLPKGTGSIGSLGKLRSEIVRKRGHMALRRLFKECGSPIQAIKPVFMMSPLSVAQFLEPGGIEFDLLIIDEASQVEPVDALGAIARSKQIVVVGDDKQLPPTSFFSKLVAGDDDSELEDDGAQAKDLESILSLCSAKGLPQRMLQWHYRSRHESLIAVSNKEFYDGNLFIVPSPDREGSHAGLHFNYFADGRFDSGSGNTMRNRVEAVAIAQAVVDHARHHPELTLGIGAMSVNQRRAISDEIELARRQHPELEHFISRHPHEPFFVKNLENIQGDERDVILISIGYGKSKSDDKMYQRFGPLNSDGGHRRLNVLITRARLRCEVFSSITADDIRVDERTKLGVAALKTYLKYAEGGDLGIPVMTGRGADSPFEESVQNALAKYQFEVQNQVGVAGFFIDLAVVDPEVPGRYLLGIECDGATYHSAPSARDRDRLRQEILEVHGWCIHRIWSTDWFQRPQVEMDKLLNAIAAAKSARNSIASTSEKAVSLEPVVAIRREEPPSPSDQAAEALSKIYTQADFKPGNANLQPHEVPVGSMAFTVERIIEVEGPIHTDEIVARVRDLWRLGRAGSRIQAAVVDALNYAAHKGQFVIEDGFYHLREREVVVRDRSTADSRTLQKPEMLPPQEIRSAITAIVCDAHGVGRDEAMTAVSRMLGFLKTSQQLRDRIDSQINVLVQSGTLEDESGVLSVS